MKLLGLLVLIAVVSAAVYLAVSGMAAIKSIPVLEKFAFATKYSSIDPDLKTIRYPAPVLLAVPADKLDELDKNRILRVWRFGDLVVVKYEAESFAEILKLYDRGVILSAMSLRAEAILPEPVRRYLDFINKLVNTTSLPIAVAHSLRDMKRVFHHVTYRYIGRNITICVIDTGVDY